MKSSWRLTEYWTGFDYIPLHTLGSLYLGAWETDEEEVLLVEELTKRKVGLVIGVGFNTHPILRFVPQMKTITRMIDDFPSSDKEMSEFLSIVLEKIYIALISGENVYVHCHAGISRSSTVVLAYLMEYHDYTLDEAIEYVRQYRPQICPNPGFMRLLEKWKKE